MLRPVMQHVWTGGRRDGGSMDVPLLVVFPFVSRIGRGSCKEGKKGSRSSDPVEGGRGDGGRRSFTSSRSIVMSGL
jgi:hypothetical protein